MAATIVAVETGRCPSGIALEFTAQFKSPERASVQTEARARLESQSKAALVSTPPKQPRLAEEALPHLLSSKRVQAKLRSENEAKRLAAERVEADKAERQRRLREGLGEKVGQAAEKRQENLATVSRKASQHFEEAVKRGQSAEEIRAGGVAAMARKLAEDLQQKNALRDAGVGARKSSAVEHNRAVEEKVKKVQEAAELRRQELRARLEKKTGSKVSGEVFEEEKDGAASQAAQRWQSLSTNVLKQAS